MDYGRKIEIAEAIENICKVVWTVAYYRVNGWNEPTWNAPDYSRKLTTAWRI